MSGPRRCGSRRPAVVGDNNNGYVETDPTGRYGRLDELLGKGAMKSMYRGFDEERGVEVAWNQAYLSDVLRTPDAVERMYSEVQLLSTLLHDAVISFHASWVNVARRTFNFITELFSSRTLRSYRLCYPRLSLRARSTRRSRLASCPKPSTASRDDDARRFIGRCLVAASRRPSAAELLTDPFLLDDHHHHSNKSVSDAVTMPPSSSLPVGAPCSSTCSSTCNVEEAADQPHAPIRTDMTITGKLNAEEDTIFLKVQIADQTADAGNNVRNIYFPFDIASDTAMEVAEEMVKELEITDREPSEIAAMIEQEIERLLPGRQQQHEYSVHVANGDDDDDENEERSPLFYYLSSSPTSSHGSLCGGVRPHDSGGYSGPHGGGWSKGEHKLV